MMITVTWQRTCWSDMYIKGTIQLSLLRKDDQSVGGALVIRVCKDINCTLQQQLWANLQHPDPAYVSKLRSKKVQTQVEDRRDIIFGSIIDWKLLWFFIMTSNLSHQVEPDDRDKEALARPNHLEQVLLSLQQLLAYPLAIFFLLVIDPR